MRNRPIAIVVALFGSLLVASGGAIAGSLDEVARAAQQRLLCRKSAGTVVIGQVTPTTRELQAIGALVEGGAPADENTLFDIGTLTRSFNGLLLADAAQRGELRFDEPLLQQLPAGAAAPSASIASVTLAQLATHGSGLPRLPRDFDPSREYRIERMYAALAKLRAGPAPKPDWAFSNWGSALLQDLLTRRLQRDYSGLIEQRIAMPLGMSDTVIAASAEQLARLAPGHDRRGRQLVRQRGEFAVVGVDSLKTSAADLLRLLRPAVEPDGSAMAQAWASVAVARKPTGYLGIDAGLEWTVDSQSGRPLIWQSGQTEGTRALVGFDPVSQVGVVVLANSTVQIEDLGLHLLDPDRDLETCQAPPAVHVELDRLRDYVGDYQASTELIIHVELLHGKLHASSNSRPGPLTPIAVGRFYEPESKGLLRFEPVAGGPARFAYFQHNGLQLQAQRIERAGRRQP